MSILIKGMEMPKSCWDCPCVNGENGYCQLRKEYVYGDVPRSCPLIPVPRHGRLIDADEMLKEHYNGNPEGSVFRASVIRPEMVEKLPTVIEAEEGET